MPDRTLNNAEIEELNIRLNKNTGDWDFDILANEWDVENLIDWGFDAEEFGILDIPKEEISLPDGEKRLAQVTFTLSNDQKNTIDNAISISKKQGPFIETGNENTNGNAISRIAEFYISHEKNKC